MSYNYNELIAWKNNSNFKSLIVLRARQCGKTYIIYEFCHKEYKNYKKINDLKILLDFDFEEKDSILFIDEIQESEELISELNFFNEKHSNIRIICVGFLLGVKLEN